MTEQDAVAANEFKRFVHQLVHLGQLKYVRRFRTGSQIEIPYSELGLQYVLNRDANDMDSMIYSTNYYAFPLSKRVPVEYNGLVLRVHTGSMHPGYARLIYERSGVELRHRTHICYPITKDSDDAAVHGPAVCCKEKSQFPKHLVHLQDLVPAVHSPYWPTEASEWITRTRRHACPSKSVIKQVVRYGCDFVGVAHKLSVNRENEDEWRFSFSMAELIIIRSWTSLQRIAYRVLRCLYKIIAQRANERNNETVLCTYYFKTLMLWACEERPEEFWAEHSLVQLIQQLLIEMAEWLTSKFCCNYFIRDNNMMDHLMDADVSCDVHALREASMHLNLIADMNILVEHQENFECTLTQKSDTPSWIHRAIVILGQIFNTKDNFEYLYSNHLSTEVQTALIQELTDVYRGLACHREAVIRDTARTDNLRCAEEHFRTAAMMWQSTDRTNATISNAVRAYIVTFFMLYDTDYKIGRTCACESVNEHSSFNVGILPKEKKMKCLLYDKADEHSRNASTAMISAVDTLSLTLYTCANKCDKHLYKTYFFRKQPKKSPTVNLTWFIAKAYLANFFYTQRHYKATIETCKTLVEAYQHSFANRWFTETSFPVLLSTQWTAVYDAELQALLGLCSLCAFVSNKTDARSVCLAVCPVQFVLYLKARCALDQRCVHDTRTRNFDGGCVIDVQSCFIDLNAHNENCYALLLSREVSDPLLGASLAILAASSPVLRNIYKVHLC